MFDAGSWAENGVGEASSGQLGGPGAAGSAAVLAELAEVEHRLARLAAHVCGSTPGEVAPGRVGGGLAADELCAAALRIEQVRRRLDAVAIGVVAALDVQGVCDRDTGLSTAGWLARDAGVARATAGEWVRVASRAVRHMPTLVEAMVAGQVGRDEAKVLSRSCVPRVAAGMDTLAQAMLDAREGMSFERWQAEVRAAVSLLDQDGAVPGEVEGPGRVRVSVTDTGLVDVHARLAGAAGAVVAEGIETMADRLWRRAIRDAEVTGGATELPGRGELRAMALAELVRLGLAHRPHGSSAPPGAEVRVVIDADDLAAWRGVDAARPVGLGASERSTLWCDAQLSAVVVDSLGVPVDLGRTVRHATSAQRRALAQRDGGCVFPGCNAPPGWTDAHHVHTWAAGGATDLANLASLCRHHHGVVHRTGWKLEPNGDGTFTLTTPAGQQLRTQRNQRWDHSGSALGGEDRAPP